MEKLRAPFNADELEWRVQRKVKTKNGWKAVVLCYVTNRAIQKRLDDVFGPFWQNKYELWQDKGVKCTISARINGEWISKEDGAEFTQVESVKGGFSAAMKRAAVQWGIGRILYDIPEVWVDLKEKGQNFCKVEEGNQKRYLYWDNPNYDELMNRQSKQPNQPKQQQKPQSQQPLKQSKGHNGKADNQDALKHIVECEKAIGFNPKYRQALFEKANGDQKIKLEEASREQLQNYYRVLFPVKSIMEAGKHYGHDLEATLAYAQTCYQDRIEKVESLFIKTDKAKAEEVIQVLKENSPQPVTA
ncbi:Rad52/Rad22 family DNA repair protein [Piscibacillus sp. B03]